MTGTTITADDIRAYSRRGQLPLRRGDRGAVGLPGSSRRACRSRTRVRALLDAWGEEFLAHGEIELRFVGMVLAGDDVEARGRRSTDDDATIAVENVRPTRTAVVGRAVGTRSTE